MNLFQTGIGRKFLFAALYFSEGAPIGFIWLALPTRLRARDVPVEQITWLAAILVLPWTLKFAWAPLVDLVRSRRWTQKHWLITAQAVMGLTLVPLLWLDPRNAFMTLAGLLLVHAVAAATQDVAIDALCVATTAPEERGAINGWMQLGMLLGRATLGGGALVLASYLGDPPVVVLLICCTTFSAFLVILAGPALREPDAASSDRFASYFRSLRLAAGERNTWLGVLFALIGGAAFKSLEVFYGPFLVDRGMSQESIGWFSLSVMIGSQILGALVGGRWSDRVGPRRVAAGGLVYLAIVIASLAAVDAAFPGSGNLVRLILLGLIGIGIGLFTASSYALFMNLSRPELAATQFSGYMGATNGCESWSSFASGKLIANQGYPTAMLAMAVVSLVALPVLLGMRRIPRRTHPPDVPEPQPANR